MTLYVSLYQEENAFMLYEQTACRTYLVCDIHAKLCSRPLRKVSNRKEFLILDTSLEYVL